MNRIRQIPYLPEALSPELMQGYVPDGHYHGLNEFIYPDYPDLPWPDTVERWDHKNDDLINSDELTPYHKVWDPEDPHSPWREPYQVFYG